MKKNSRLKNSMKNLIALFASRIVSAILQFINRTIFINTLGKSYLGIGSLFSNILTMLSIAELGIDTAMNFKLYKPLAENDTPRLRAIMKFYRYSYIIVGFVILFLGLIIIPFLPYIIKDYETLATLNINPVYIFLLYLTNSVVSYWFFASNVSIIKADQKEHILTITGMISRIVVFVFQTTILLIWKNYILYISIGILIGIVTNIINAIIAKKMYPDIFIYSKDFLSYSEIKNTLKDLGAEFISKLNNVVLKTTDNIIISFFLGLSEVAMYSNYFMFYASSRSLLIHFYRAIRASVGNLFATADDNQKYSFFEFMNFISVILFGIAAIGVGVVGNEFILNWIGSSYVLEQPFPILIGIEIVFVGIKLNLDQIRNTTGLFRQMWLRPILGIFINLIVSIVLVKKIGLSGVVIGTISSDFLTNFLLDPPIIYKYAFKNNYSLSSYYINNFAYFILLFAIGSFSLYLCSNYYVGKGWLSVIVHSLLCLLLTPSAFIILYRNTPKCQYLLSTINRICSKSLFR